MNRRSLLKGAAVASIFPVVAKAAPAMDGGACPNGHYSSRHIMTVEVFRADARPQNTKTVGYVCDKCNLEWIIDNKENYNV